VKKPVLLICLAALTVLALAALAAFVWPGFLLPPSEDGAAPALPPEDGGLQVWFIDVGQGDSTLLSDGTHTVLIDAGDRDHGNKVYSQLHSVCPEDHIDILIITHDHADHTGGLTKILKECTADVIYAPSYDGENLSGMAGLLEEQRRRGAAVVIPEVNETVELGDIRLLLHCMAGAKNENDGCIITRAQYGSTVFLFMADAGTDGELDYLLHSGQTDPDCDVLRVSHHGSDTSTTQKFLNGVKPEYAVISAGKDNQYGLPDAVIVTRLAAAGCNPWITGQFGTILAVSDGTHVSLRTSLAEAPELAECSYIGNKNTHKLHDKECPSVTQMKEGNKVPFNSIEEARSQGYDLCTNCLGGQ